MDDSSAKSSTSSYNCDQDASDDDSTYCPEMMQPFDERDWGDDDEDNEGVGMPPAKANLAASDRAQYGKNGKHLLVQHGKGKQLHVLQHYHDSKKASDRAQYGKNGKHLRVQHGKGKQLHVLQHYHDSKKEVRWTKECVVQDGRNRGLTATQAEREREIYSRLLLASEVDGVPQIYVPFHRYSVNFLYPRIGPQSSEYKHSDDSASLLSQSLSDVMLDGANQPFPTLDALTVSTYSLGGPTYRGQTKLYHVSPDDQKEHFAETTVGGNSKHDQGPGVQAFEHLSKPVMAQSVGLGVPSATRS
jgi:hypothetical protein